MAKRRCSICHKTGHDRRFHGKPAKRTRRNIDAFTDASGLVHPIRGSEGYSVRQLERRQDYRSRYGIDSTQQQLERRWKDYGAVMRQSRELTDMEVEAEELKEDLKRDPAGQLQGLLRKSGGDRGEINRIPIGQARGIFKKFLGTQPERYKTAIVKDKQGHTYLRWEYVLDELADSLGYDDGEDLKDAVERYARKRDKLRALENKIERLGAELRGEKTNPGKRRNGTPRQTGARGGRAHTNRRR